ncbi:hypothetical protein Tco_0159181 [Tanacetum coccineum]
MANDDPILTTMRFIPQHEVVQKYGAILHDNLTTQAMKESKAYKTYYTFATGKAIPKPKYVRRTTKEKTIQAPKASFALSEAEQMKIALESSKTQQHNSLASCSGVEKGTSVKLGVPDIPSYDSEDEEISWKSSDDEGGDDARKSKDDQDDADSDSEWTESDNDGDEFGCERQSRGKRNDMIDATRTIVQTTQVVEDTHVIIPPVNPEVTAIAEPPLLSATALHPPLTPLITHLFDRRLKTLENNFLEFNQMNQFVAAVSLIPGIVDAYLANKMHKAVKTAIQLQSERLKDEAQDENADFINKLDDNIKKIIKNQVKEQVKAQVSKILSKIEKTINEQLKAKVLTHSSNESKTSHAVAANLSELELKKILIDKMESNKSIHKFDEQKNLYKALVNTYKSDKLILDTYRDTVLFKRCRDDEDKDKKPSAGSN